MFSYQKSFFSGGKTFNCSLKNWFLIHNEIFCVNFICIGGTTDIDIGRWDMSIIETILHPSCNL